MSEPSEAPRVILVTGSTDGIGKQTAIDLARAGARVIVHGRSRPRVEHALAEVRAAAPGAAVEGVSFDLGSLVSVRKGAAELAERFPAIHVLINNAGIFASERVLSADGIETTLAVNHVGPFLLTELLMPQLLRAAPARVIVVSSMAHTRGKIHFDDLNLERGFTGYTAYAQSKLANVMHALALAERHPVEALTAHALHPGVIATKLLREGFGPVRGAPVEAGARSSVALALTPTEELDVATGAYWSEGVATPPATAAQDEAARRALWAASERLAGLASTPATPT